MFKHDRCTLDFLITLVISPGRGRVCHSIFQFSCILRRLTCRYVQHTLNFKMTVTPLRLRISRINGIRCQDKHRKLRSMHSPSFLYSGCLARTSFTSSQWSKEHDIFLQRMRELKQTPKGITRSSAGLTQNAT